MSEADAVKNPDTEKERSSAVSLDIVIPVFNEEKVIGQLFERLRNVFCEKNRIKNHLERVRYIIVDDGSTDCSAEIISRYIKDGFPAVLYRFSRNFGHQNAVAAGLEQADADAVAVIDADLQDPPEIIFQMLEKRRQGYDIVHGIRKKRKENFLKVSAYWLFYRFLSFISEIDIPLDSGDFSLLDKRALEAVKSLPEKLRYPRVLRAWVGFRQVSVAYDRPERAAGKPKYSFSSLYKLATDGVASASIRPLKISQVFSLFYLFLVTILAFVFFYQIVFKNTADQTFVWFMIGYLLIALGGLVQVFCIYILSAYIGRSYLEIKGRPSYIIMEVVKKEENLKKSGRS
ncbi:MAG: glycosyltransferase family 2 protein [Candidatus Aureabacteria bacterium]|nr:glycosyltransferase family 2 protein [Candidatus Auribacterota bacterium]